MTPQQTKLTLAAVAVVAVLGGTYALNRTASGDKAGGGKDGAELADADVRHGKVSLGGRRGSGGNDDAAKVSSSGKNGRNGSSGASAGDAGIASIVDAVTTEVMPIETEAETRERERYEEAMKNKFKYRELDPEKIKPAELQPALQDVTEEYGLPENLLAAVMYVETGGTHRFGDHSIDAGYGVMNLKENNMVDTLGEAASLIGKSKDEVLYDQATNIKAAGALLKSYYDDAIASGLSESEAWYTAVSQYSGIPDPELASNIADETAGWLMKGISIHTNDGGGDLEIPGTATPPFTPKNWELVGMDPPSGDQGAVLEPGVIPPNAESYGDSSAVGGATVAP